MSSPPPVLPLRYVAIGTRDVERSLSLYRDTLGMTVVGTDVMAADDARALLGVDGEVRRTMLAQDDVHHGMVQLVVFPAAGEPIALRPDDHGIIKTLDVFVDDIGVAGAALRAGGFDFAKPPRGYDGGDGLEAVEGHVDAPDGVALALLALGGIDRSLFARARTTFSEVGASSQVVDDLGANLAFYTDGMGFEVHYDQTLEGAGVDDLVGLPPGTGLRLVIVAPPEATTGKVGLLQPGRLGASRARERRPPAPGLSAHGFETTELEELAARLERLGGGVLSAPRLVTLAPFGSVEAMVVTSPAGVRLELFRPR